MINTISEIRSLLDRLEEETEAFEGPFYASPFSGSELPDIIRDIVDLLFPIIGPYEASFYMYLFRKSILETGNQLLRVGVKRLQVSVVRNAYAGTNLGGSREGYPVSYKKVTDTLTSLEKIGALRREAEPNREGTLYRVLLPEEIEACRERKKELEKENNTGANMDIESDYYNVRENRLKVFERDSYICQYCRKQLTRFTATLDHIKSVKDGGDNSLDNLLTSCLRCNSRKNSQLLGDFLADSNPIS